MTNIDNTQFAVEMHKAVNRIADALDVLAYGRCECDYCYKICGNAKHKDEYDQLNQICERCCTAHEEQERKEDEDLRRRLDKRRAEQQ